MHWCLAGNSAHQDCLGTQADRMPPSWTLPVIRGKKSSEGSYTFKCSSLEVINSTSAHLFTAHFPELITWPYLITREPGSSAHHLSITAGKRDSNTWYSDCRSPEARECGKHFLRHLDTDPWDRSFTSFSVSHLENFVLSLRKRVNSKIASHILNQVRLGPCQK